jgi:hypothetical protein
MTGFPLNPPQYNLNPPSQPFPICRLSTCGKQLYRTDKVVAINAECAFHVECAIQMGVELIAAATLTEPDRLFPLTDQLLQTRFGRLINPVMPHLVTKNGVLETVTMTVDDYCAACGSELGIGEEVKAYVPNDPQAAVIYLDPGCVVGLGMVLKREI